MNVHSLRSRIGTSLLVGVIWWLLLKRFPDVVGFGLGIPIILSAILGWILLVAGLPFLFWVMAEPVYKIFFKPYVRVWRINRIRNARLLRETLEHDSTEN